MSWRLDACGALIACITGRAIAAYRVTPSDHFELCNDGQFEPVEDLALARRAKGLSDAVFRAPESGGGYDVPPLHAFSGCLR